MEGHGKSGSCNTARATANASNRIRLIPGARRGPCLPHQLRRHSHHLLPCGEQLALQPGRRMSARHLVMWRWRLVRLKQPRTDRRGRDLLQEITRLAIGAPRRVIAVVLLVMVGTAIVGIPVPKSLSAGGTRDPTSESSQATKLLSDKFDQGDMAMIVTVTSNDGVESPAVRAVGTDIVRQLQTSPHIVQVTSAWTDPRCTLADQRRPQDGADRGQHVRQRQRGTEVRQTTG